MLSKQSEQEIIIGAIKKQIADSDFQKILLRTNTGQAMLMALITATNNSKNKENNYAKFDAAINQLLVLLKQIKEDLDAKPLNETSEVEDSDQGKQDKEKVSGLINAVGGYLKARANLKCIAEYIQEVSAALYSMYPDTNQRQDVNIKIFSCMTDIETYLKRQRQLTAQEQVRYEEEFITQLTNIMQILKNISFKEGTTITYSAAAKENNAVYCKRKQLFSDIEAMLTEVKDKADKRKTMHTPRTEIDRRNETVEWKNKDSMKAHGELCRLILNTNNSGAQIKAQMAALAVIARFYISIDPRVGKFGNNGSNTDVISSADNKVLEAAGVSISEHGGFVCSSNDDFNGQLQCLEKMAMHENHKSADGKGALLGCTRSIQSFYNEVLLPFDQDHKPVKGNFMAWGTAPKAQKNVIEKLNKIADTPKLYSDVKYRV